MPHIEWKPESMRFMMCFFPLVGVCIGLACWLWCRVVATIGFSQVVLAAGLTCIPVVITGGIHLDGLADCIDAQASHDTSKRKREILKDPHSGAFAIIGIASYLILYFSFSTEFSYCWQTMLLMGCMFVLSRSMSGIATIAFPTSSDSGMLASFHASASKRASFVILVVIASMCAALMLWIHPAVACIMLACALLSLLACYIFAKTQFGGMSGDIAGAFLQCVEIIMLVCLVTGWKVLVV